MGSEPFRSRIQSLILLKIQKIYNLKLQEIPCEIRGIIPIQMKKVENPNTFKYMTKYGYGKTSLHIGHHNLFQKFSLSIAVL